MAKMMKKAQNGADMVSKIKSAASKPSGDRKMGMNFDKKSFDSVKSFDSLPSILGKPLPKMKKKAKNGTSFGMLSVKAGVDKNPKATFADKIAGAKKMAKSGKKMKKAQYGVDMTPGAMKMGGKAAKQAAIAIAMKKAGKAPKKASYGKMMKSGGKCKNGC
jgi:lambda repressor-like predicted transcriptional regulator